MSKTLDRWGLRPRNIGHIRNQSLFADFIRLLDNRWQYHVLFSSIVVVVEVIAVSSSDQWRWTLCSFVLQFAISPNSLRFIAIDFIIGKRECSSALPDNLLLTCAVYADSFLASLNSRNALRGRSLRSGHEGTSFRINAIDLSTLGSSSEGDSADARNKTSVRVSVGEHVKTDGDLGLLEVCTCVPLSLFDYWQRWRWGV